jgi:MFS family permease
VRGRLYLAITSVFLGAVFLSITLNIPVDQIPIFRIFLSLTSFFIPLASPNIATTVYDVVLPEVRSTATSIQYFLGNIGSAFAPLLAGYIGQLYSLEFAMLSISLVSWLITATFLAISTVHLPKDREKMHQALAERTNTT